MKKVFKAVLFSDLDGTFLDHHTYSAGEVSEVLNLLETRHIPLVFCSSKTFAEQRFIQQRYGIQAPFIFENGCGIAIPDGYFKPGRYEVWKRVDGFDIVRLAREQASALHAFLKQFAGFTGFKQASDDVLAEATGLCGAALGRARDRWFTETLLQPLNKDEMEAFAEQFLKNGWTFSRGGRFVTIQSDGTDKGRALKFLKTLFSAGSDRSGCMTAAVGDSTNDQPMLEAADCAFLVQQPTGNWADMDLPGVHRVNGVGPAGFQAAVGRLVEMLNAC